MRNTSGDDHLTRYLLGHLSSEEEERLEEDYLGSHDRFLELAAAEDDLVDDYVADRLSADDRRRFEDRLLVQPAIRERVSFAHALARTPTPAIASRPAGRRTGALAAAAVFAVAAVAGWTQWNLLRTRGELTAAVAREESLRAEAAGHAERIAEKDREVASAQAGILTWTLAAGRTRGTDARPGSFSAPARGWVRLLLPLEKDVYPRYSISLRAADGKEFLAATAARVGGGAVEAMVPAADLPAGTFDVLLLGAADAAAWDEVDVYPLRIVTQQAPPKP